MEAARPVVRSPLCLPVFSCRRLAEDNEAAPSASVRRIRAPLFGSVDPPPPTRPLVVGRWRPKRRQWRSSARSVAPPVPSDGASVGRDDALRGVGEGRWLVAAADGWRSSAGSKCRWRRSSARRRSSVGVVVSAMPLGAAADCSPQPLPSGPGPNPEKVDRPDGPTKVKVQASGSSSASRSRARSGLPVFGLGHLCAFGRMIELPTLGICGRSKVSTEMFGQFGLSTDSKRLYQ